jgi:hypothetical protein
MTDDSLQRLPRRGQIVCIRCGFTRGPGYHRCGEPLDVSDTASEASGAVAPQSRERAPHGQSDGAA